MLNMLLESYRNFQLSRFTFLLLFIVIISCVLHIERSCQGDAVEAATDRHKPAQSHELLNDFP